MNILIKKIFFMNILLSSNFSSLSAITREFSPILNWYLYSTETAQLGFNDNCCETNGEFNLIKSLINPHDVVFDVGANIGEWSQKVLITNPSVSLYSFEPMNETFNLLKNNLSNTSTSLFNIGFSNRNKQELFYYYPTESVLSGIYERPIIKEQLGMEYTQALVDIMTCDNFCEAHNISHINFMKIDTEGSENDILEGAHTMIKAHKIDCIQFEYGGTFLDAHTTLQKTYHYLTNQGYFIFRIVPHGLMHISEWDNRLEDFQYCNYLAITPKKYSEIR